MAQTPKKGPMARAANAKRQPTASTRDGTRCTVASVRMNPTQVCMVSMVPTVPGSDSSAIEAENWAESATTTTPQNKAKENTSQGAAPNK